VTGYPRPELIGFDHDVSDFDCGSVAQTTWLRRHALAAQAANSARTYVVRHAGTRTVVGYYALVAGSVAHEAVPPRVTKGIGRYPVPVVVLARLGVDLREQGRGLGAGLVQDALLQTAAVSDRVAVRALLIHAETPEAVAFYRHVSPAFEPSPTDLHHLILLMKDLRASLRGE
jgi:hypothetical protein